MAELDAQKKAVWDHHEEQFNFSEKFKSDTMTWVATKWDNFVLPTQVASFKDTGVDLDYLRRIGARLCEVPEGFKLHNGLKLQLKKKREDLEKGTAIDWATAE